jgi:DNA mismatch repair protein MutS2
MHGERRMDEHTLALLEFPKIIDELAALCVSPEGAAALRGQPLLTEPKPLADAHALALEFRAILESGESLPGFDFPDLDGILPTLGKPGMQLEGEELAAIGRWVLSGLKLKRIVLKSGARRLGVIASEIPDLTPLSRRIFHIVDPEGLLKEKQIPELAAIRERIRRHRADADRAVRGLLEDHDYHAYWQTTTPTQRDGRVVLPLKSQYKGRVKGIVHEMSASGSTLFIEPLEVVEKNNAIVQEENLYRLEVRRILRELTAEVSARAGELSLMVERAAFLDTILARARYALQHSCRRADMSEGAAGSPGSIELRDARHPLLGQRVVPVSVSAGADNRVLIITGPNTGGKTVSLKMVGLLALMNQFGMEIPAAEGSLLPLFDEIFADIGDEQSIEQSLSTFSAHIGNLSRIVRRVTSRSLVLLDELGAGTDPQEGVALAMALLDHFLTAGCLVLVSTHHGILKNYGATRPGAQNASMGFDRQTLGPTYRILMGVPGESHALEIARRSGLPESVLSNASSYLEGERTDISRIVSNLAERHHKLVKAEEEQEALAHDLREKWRTTDLKALTLRQKELELRRHGLKELRDFLGEARREWDALREKGAAPGGADFGRFAAGIQERIAREESRIEQEGEALLPAQSFEPREGLDVVIVRTGRRGKVVRRDKGKRWVVETETLRLSLLPGEMRPADAAEGSPLVSVSYTPASPIDPPVLELHVRGMRLDEAMRLVEKQIDAAVIHGLREFSIVHGKGEGILRTAIHAYLRDANVVADFRFSAPEEGGFGKTIVTLK